MAMVYFLLGTGFFGLCLGMVQLFERLRAES